MHRECLDHWRAVRVSVQFAFEVHMVSQLALFSLRLLRLFNGIHLQVVPRKWENLGSLLVHVRIRVDLDFLASFR